MSSPSVRVQPSRVEFREVRVGQVYRTTVTVTNVGGASRDIVLQKPPSKVEGLAYCRTGVCARALQDEGLGSGYCRTRVWALGATGRGSGIWVLQDEGLGSGYMIRLQGNLQDVFSLGIKKDSIVLSDVQLKYRPAFL